MLSLQHMNTKQIQTKWNLNLFYKSDTDPQIKKDMELVEKDYDAFVKKYAYKKDYLIDEKKLLKALKDYETLLDLPVHKPFKYFFFRLDIDSSDAAVRAHLASTTEWLNKQSNKLVFFTLALTHIESRLQKKYLASKVLSHYRYFLKCIFEQSKHVLTEKEEQLLTMISMPAHRLWVQGTEKILNTKTVTWKGKQLPLTEAQSIIFGLSTKDRHVLGKSINTALMSLGDIAESEINAIVTGKKIEDELRGYTKPYEATVCGYQNELDTVENLVSTVTKNFKIGHRFYAIKAKMLRLKTLTYWDRGASVGDNTTQISFEKAFDIVQKAFNKVDPIYGNMFEQFFIKGHVDVFPKVGKRGGAYSAGGGKIPTMMLLNHTPDFRSITILAHEMGHSFHSELSKAQSPLYQDYTISAAEVASTLFENFVFDELLPTLSPREQIVALHNKISDSVSTVFRQIACFNFEYELHMQIREKGSISKKDIVLLLNKHMNSYLGPQFKLTEDDGYFFVSWNHIRRFFYVYSYAFGALISDALYVMYKKDKDFEKKIRDFLSAGGSASPEDIFSGIGINVRDPKFFELGLKKIEADIEKLEVLVKKSW